MAAEMQNHSAVREESGGVNNDRFRPFVSRSEDQATERVDPAIF
jgi:hypothetical protein